MGAASPSSGVTISVAYDVTTNSYTIANGIRTLTFAPTDVSITAPAVIYAKTAGATTDTLSLFNHPTATNGTPYQFVTAGYLQSTMQNGTIASASLEAFTYGITTSDQNLPRTGEAGYAINVNGVIAPGASLPATGPLSIQGSGAMIVDFARYTFNTNATFYSIPATGSSASGGLSSSATMSSSRNAFSGIFNYYTQAQNNRESGVGVLAGKFYGPGAEEVGATFYANSAGGSAFIGSILGTVDASMMTAKDTLEALDQPTNFVSTYSRYCFGNVLCNAGITFNSSGIGGVPNAVTVDPATSTYTFNINPFSTPFSVGPPQISPIQADPSFTTYDTVVNGGSGPAPHTINIYKSGSSNPEINLTYTSFADILYELRDSGGNTTGGSRKYVTFGMMTPSAQFPRAGTLSYTGILRGSGTSPTNSMLELTGTSKLTLELNSANRFLVLAPVARDISTGMTANLGPQIQEITVFSTQYGMQFQSANGESVVAGAFFGPNAEEAAGTFKFKYTGTALGAGEAILAGAFAAKKD